jgi:glutamate synthase domain-containing protein 3
METKHCMGERYVACGSSGREYMIDGTPGNDLGAYLDGSTVKLQGNAQDATGNTMNNGSIIVYGNTGDTAGYAMRGGSIFIRNNAGYRAGIHMKAYREKLPLLVVGGKCGSFLGEYQAGGVIIVLGIGYENTPPVGDFCATGMHGGKIFIRCTEENLPHEIPNQVIIERANEADTAEIEPYISRFCEHFNEDKDAILNSVFYKLTPNNANPYKTLYVNN